jgi:hypothetical protein
VKTAWLAALALSTTACFRIHYVSGVSPASSPSYERRSHTALYGIVEVSDTLPVTSVCPVGVAEVSSRHGFIDTVIAALSVGAAVPQTVSVTCSKDDPHPFTQPYRPWP